MITAKKKLSFHSIIRSSCFDLVLCVNKDFVLEIYDPSKFTFAHTVQIPKNLTQMCVKQNVQSNSDIGVIILRHFPEISVTTPGV